ncbi:dienelactone hydrolase family protein [Pseudomassariella vexata]|uniref:Dienelactone hydrolase family protein n=1 Tax=Pseudomassariella vexata TaxID=1141098 RepID=A0A1Y2DZW8_9PEZI|nr:dienelactone hydrolase family protein [Pseudomassariella vexata]ORY64828.1 dienelactone hydrolase family protein [Pseudomassariella vexata]
MPSDTKFHSCTTGHLHEGTPTGKMKSIRGIQTYYATSANGSARNAIIIFTDVMGHNFVNAQLVADNFASNGFFTVMPDLFRGDAVTLNRSDSFDLMNWLKNHPPEQIIPIIKVVMKEMREVARCQHIFGVGYCIGAKYLLRALQPGVLDAGFIAHPTHLAHEEILGINGPLSVAAATNDDTFTTHKRHEMEMLLEKTKQPYQMNLFSGVGHGFAVRGKTKDPHGRFAKERALSQAVQWFKYFLNMKKHEPARASS